jgi:hypothetical protein
VTDLLESFFEAARIVDPHDTAKEEVGNETHTDGNEQTHPEPQHTTMDDAFCKDRVRIKERCNDQQEDRVPEILDLMCIDVIVLVFILLDLQQAEFIVEEH